MGRASIAAVLLVFAAAACGDDGGGGTSEREQEYVDAAVASLDAEDLPLDEDEAACFAERFVRIIGVDALEDAGIEPEDFGDEDFALNEAGLEFDEDQGRELADGFGECGVSMTDLLVASIEGEGAELSDDARDCLEENLDDDAFGEFFAQAFVDPEAFEDDPPEEFVSMFLQLAADCPELVEIAG